MKRAGQSENSYGMEQLSRKLAKLTRQTQEIADQTFQPTRHVDRRGFRLPERANGWRRQYASGVTPLIAIALRFDVDPWELSTLEEKAKQ